MKLKQNQSGLGHILVAAIVVVSLAAVGFVGVRLQNQSKAASTTPTASTCGSGYSKKYSSNGLLVFVRGQGTKTNWCGFHVFKSDGSWSTYVSVKGDGQSKKTDSGHYRSYSGPVKASNTKSATFEWGAGKDGRGFADSKRLSN